MPKINLDTIPSISSTGYPAPYDEPVKGRYKQNIGDTGGLSQFGAGLITLKPGAWSSQRHHHSAEDELVYILAGQPTLIDDHGEQILKPGDFTTHPAGDGNGHHMINQTDEDVVFLIIGTRNPEEDHCRYPDIDLDLPATGTRDRLYRKKSGQAW